MFELYVLPFDVSWDWHKASKARKFAEEQRAVAFAVERAKSLFPNHQVILAAGRPQGDVYIVEVLLGNWS